MRKEICMIYCVYGWNLIKKIVQFLYPFALKKEKKRKRYRYHFVTIRKTFNVFHLLTSVYGSISAITQRYDAILVSKRCWLLIPIYNLCVVTFRCCNICMHRRWLFPSRLSVGITRWNFLYKDRETREKVKTLRNV